MVEVDKKKRLVYSEDFKNPDIPQMTKAEEKILSE
jgi:hypothetical protein